MTVRLVSHFRHSGPGYLACETEVGRCRRLWVAFRWAPPRVAVLHLKPRKTSTIMMMIPTAGQDVLSCSHLHASFSITWCKKTQQSNRLRRGRRGRPRPKEKSPKPKQRRSRRGWVLKWDIKRSTFHIFKLLFPGQNPEILLAPSSFLLK